MPNSNGQPDRLTNAFSVDVEDYYHVSAFDDAISRTEWPNYESRVEANTHRLLDLLDDKDVHGTFYVLGYVADQHPQLVQEIAERGHEVGCHSFWHRRVNELSRDEFREDTHRAKSLLENLAGTAVHSYRAPSFSITHQARWAWEVLAELGFRVDSSLCPARHGSSDEIRTGLHRITTPAGDLWQFPISIKRYGRLRLPISGGGYFRLFPLQWNIRQLENINRAGDPFVFYIHPWEIDPDQPRIRGGKFTSRLRHYVRLSKTYGKLERLLDSFQFSTVESLVREAAA